MPGTSNRPAGIEGGCATIQSGDESPHSKVRVIPSQLSFDVRGVRTADHPLFVVQLLIFFELENIDKMPIPTA